MSQTIPVAEVTTGDTVDINGFAYEVRETVPHGLSSRKLSVQLIRPNGSRSSLVVEVVYHGHEHVLTFTR